MLTWQSGEWRKHERKIDNRNVIIYKVTNKLRTWTHHARWSVTAAAAAAAAAAAVAAQRDSIIQYIQTQLSSRVYY